jgi:uncharacterized protein YndB with AHSA1/START domain
MDPERPWSHWADPEAGTGTLVQVTREFPAPREEVFRAWTEPELFRQWFRPSQGSSPSAEMDVRPGGRYRLTIELPPESPGTTYLVGTYLEVVPPERLVYTFGYEQTPYFEELEDVDSRVTVRFRDLGGSTEVSITHERLDTEDLRAFHRWGWEGALERLADLVLG